MIKTVQVAILGVVLLFSGGRIQAQIQVSTGVFSPQDLIQNVFLASGVEVLDVKYFGSPGSIGYFSAGQTNIGIESGIVMSTGMAADADNTNGVGGGGFASSPTSMNQYTDPDLASLVAPMSVGDLCIFEITFIPYADTVEFNYVFGSEEYEEYVCTPFNDVFGFFISGPGINGPFSNNGENIALVPGTNDFVAIGTVNNGNPNQSPSVCPPQNSQYFNVNVDGAQPVYDGFTDVFTARSIVMACDTYTIRLSLADASDFIFDSGVFLQAKSFGTTTIDVEVTTEASNETIAEGCSNGLGSFAIRYPAPQDVVIPINFIGTATFGVDYNMDPPSITIPQGTSEVTATFEVFSDNINEGRESVGMVIQRDPCKLDTIWFYITDDTLPKPDLGPDLLVCTNDLVPLDGTLPVLLPSPKMFENNTPFALTSPPDNSSPLMPVYSPIQVTNVFPKDLGPGMIESVCLNIDHKWIDDIDIYLVAPSGRFIELSSDNGRDGDNYTETCFSPKATQPIDYGDPFGAPKTAAPFTGTFQPEGNWHNLWDAPANPANGEWRLLVIDDAPLPNGTLQNWRISFNPEYSIDYTWTPGVEVVCDTCSSTTTILDLPKVLTLDVVDSYGCRRADTVAIDVKPDVDVPIIDCADIGFEHLVVAWNDQTLGENYEVSVNFGPWQSPNQGPFSFRLDGLALEDSITFIIKAVGLCNEEADTIGCRTMACTPPALVVDQVSMPSCFGQANGSFNVSIGNGVDPVTILLDGNPVSSGVIGNLGAGSYLISAADTLGCTDEMMLVLTQPDALDIPTVEVDTVTCFQAQNGLIAPVVQGGTYPYQFVWQDGQTDSLRTGLNGGLYSVTITDLNGCSMIQDVSLFEYPDIQVNPTTTDPTCENVSNGAIDLMVSGGAGAYQFDWSNNGVIGSNPTSLPAGNYSVTITDKNGCTDVQLIPLVAPANILVDITVEPTSCFGGDDGKITVSVTGGTPPYDFMWSDGGPNVNQRLNLTAGNYSLTVSDQGACVEIRENLIVVDPSEIVVTPNIIDVSCAGGNDGMITVTATGGGGGHDFSWSIGGVMGPMITNLTAGIYIVTTTDASNCSVMDTFQVIQPAPIVTSVGSTNVKCFGGASGSATVGASGGAGGFQFLWNDPSASTSASVGGLMAGTYRVTVTDQNGCSAIDSVNVNQPPPFISVVTPGQISCFGVNDGEGTVTPLGGTGPYSFLWNDPLAQTTATAMNLFSGTYIVTITDVNGCTTLDTLVLADPPELTSAIDPTNITCFGSNDGKAQATATGGSQPYQFSWSTGTKQSLAQNLPPGTHTVTITDSRGCTSVSTTTIDQAPELVLSGSATSVQCAGDKDGTIDLNVTGGANPYSFLWNNGATVEDPVGLGPGIYVVTVTDANNCKKTFNLQVTSPPGMTGEYESTDIACFGDSTGTITAAITGGSPDYSYLWSNGSTSPDVSGLLPGVYSVTVTDGNGCTISNSIEIFQPLEPLVATMIADTLDCFGDGNGRVVFDVTGGTPTYKYSLDGTTFNGSSIQIGLKAGTYDGYVRDKVGCAFYVGQVTIYQPDPVLVDLGADGFIELGRDTQLVAQVTNGVQPLTYQWNAQDSSFLSCLTCPDPMVNGLQFTRSFRVLVTDANGCTGEAVITVNVQKTRIILVPTAFTPNGDLNNDRLGIVGRPGTQILNFQVFDRWGEMVFLAEDFPIEDGLQPGNSWDGTFRGEPMNSAVFVWSLEALFPDGERMFLKGQSTLLR